jgi:hypothetical protein
VEELEGRLVPSAVVSTSTNWSGYAVSTAAGAVTDVAGKWVVPAVTGTGTGYSSAWVGIDGFNSPTVEQIGTDSDVVNGVPQYYAWFEMYPSGSVLVPLSIHAGDTISADVSYASGKFTLSLTDVTTGQSYTTTQAAPGAQRSSAEWIMEAPSSFFGVLPLANFGKATFTGAKATVGGTTGPIDNTAWSGAHVNQIDMVSYFGASEDTTSGLTDSGSPATSSFTVTYTTATATPPPARHHHWWWFAPDQDAAPPPATTSAGAPTATASTSTATPSTASTSAATTSTATATPALGPALVGALSQPASSASPPARQQLAAAAAAGVVVSPALAPSSGASAAAAAALRLDPGGQADAPAGPELLPAPAESGVPGDRSAPLDAGATPLSEGSSADVVAGAAVRGAACDAVFLEARAERAAAPEGAGASLGPAADGETTAEAAAGLLLSLAVGGSWRRAAEGTGARRRRPWLSSPTGT